MNLTASSACTPNIKSEMRLKIVSSGLLSTHVMHPSTSALTTMPHSLPPKPKPLPHISKLAVQTTNTHNDSAWNKNTLIVGFFCELIFSTELPRQYRLCV